MSHFYGVVTGQAKTQATRRGSKNTGLRVAAASWNGGVFVRLWHDAETGLDHYAVELGPWRGHGRCEILATGTIK
jgi:hypothetical protein